MYPNGYKYRDWVTKALNDDMPYDRFVVEQVAGDLVDEPGATTGWPRSASSPSARSTTAGRSTTSWTTGSTP